MVEQDTAMAEQDSFRRKPDVKRKIEEPCGSHDLRAICRAWMRSRINLALRSPSTWQRIARTNAAPGGDCVDVLAWRRTMGRRVSFLGLSSGILRQAWTGAVAIVLSGLAFVDCTGAARRGAFDAEDASAGTFSAGDATTHDRPCEGLECSVVECAPGEETSLDGRVLAPNGTLPLAGALVFVGAGGAPEIATGVSCETCATLLPPRPVAVAISQADGTFSLRGVPIGQDIPVVIQVGKWRRTVVVPEVKRCARQRLPEEQTRLPRNRQEGQMPRIALTTGACDDIG